MLKEYAVDPNVIASSFETCRYLISLFGADKGRLISKFPRQWKQMAIRAADDALNDGLKKERVIEYINSLDNDWLTLIPSNRASVDPEGAWLVNAQAAHAARPFSAIIGDQDDEPNQIIDGNSCDESHPLLAVSRTCAVNRWGEDLARPASLMLQHCRQLRLVDPYFDPGRPKWRRPLAAILATIPEIRRVACEYHILLRVESPPVDELKRRLQQLRDAIPAGGSLRIVRWREHDGGERFHRRYLLTENAGLNYEGGLDQEIGANQTTDVSLLDREHHTQRWNEYNLDSQVYELVEPVLLVDSSGNVTEV